MTFNDAWSWDSTAFFDHHVYVGYFRHYLEFEYPFTENYKSSRLPYLYPGVLLYSVLPDAVAHHAVFLLFLVGEAVLLFLWAKPRFGAHAAFATGVMQASFLYAHTSPSYHNQAGAAYFVASLVLLDRPMRWPFWLRAMLGGGMFATAATTDIIVTAFAPIFALYAVVAVPPPRIPKVLLSGASALAGAVLALALLGAINAALGGPFLFFVEQIKVSLFLADRKYLSSIPVDGYLSSWRFPWLMLPTVATVGSVALLFVRIAQRRFDQGALAAIALITSMAAAAAMHARGLGMLEYAHLFHPFFTPGLMAIAAILAPSPNGAERAKPAVAAWFLAAGAAAVVAPLAFFGRAFSRMQIALEPGWAAYANGSLVSFALILVAVPLALWWRQSPMAVSGIALGAFGLVNALSAPATQPAYLYDVRERCAFRRDFFSALLEGDKVLETFDPKNQSYWGHTPVQCDRQRYDGKGWCTLLPMETVARAILLPRYFFTSIQFANGGLMPFPMKKLVIAAPTTAQAEQLAADHRAASPNLKFMLKLDHTISRPTLSVVLRGYDVAPGS